MPGKRSSRRGKQGPSGASSSERSTPLPLSSVEAEEEGAGGGDDHGPPQTSHALDNNARSHEATTTNNDNDMHDLILTSERRHGVYECDYCHTDISQVPRIRCAVTPDFDLCLECFMNTDHDAAAARLRAAWDTQQALQEDGRVPAASGSSSTSPSSSLLLSTAKPAPPHSQVPMSKGYRVCDSTRYPLMPTAKHMATVKQPATANSSSSNNNNDTDNNNPSSDTKDDTAMGVDSDAPTTAKSDEEMKDGKDAANNGATTTAWAAASLEELATAVLDDDPKTVWTAEEDLRLLEGIRAHGLGNWVEIAEVVAGATGSSVGKTPRRCMERYMDDYLGRYGHILPPFTLVMEDIGTTTTETTNMTSPVSESDGIASTDAVATADDEKPSAVAVPSSPAEGSPPRSSKRRAVLLRSPSGVSSTAVAAGWTSHKRFKCVPTESLVACSPSSEEEESKCAGTTAAHNKYWPRPYLPNDQVQVGTEVGRDQAAKAEQTYVRLTTAAASAEEAARIRQSWEATRKGKPGGPTVLPPRLDDIVQMPGSELLGFMPRRGDFDIEWENDAEQSVADMEFLPGEPAADRALKLQVLAIYNSKLDERERRKQFILSRKLWDYQKAYRLERDLPADERDLVLRMRLFERFHTAEEHAKFLADILKAKRLRKEIAKLQMYRRMGIRTMAEAERYELDKQRRLIHKNLRKGEDKKDESSSSKDKSAVGHGEETSSTSLWKQYRTGERRNRKSINRGERDEVDSPATAKADSEPIVATADVAPTSSLPATERELCETLGLTEDEYKQIKKALITESLAKGLLDKETFGSPKRSLVKMDCERRGKVIDFFLRAGWISAKGAAAIR